MTAVELVLALHATRGVGDSAIEAVLRGAAIARLTPDDVCRLEPRDLRSRFGLPEAQAMKIAEGLRVHGADAREMSRRLRALDVAVLAVTDAAYPERLTESAEHPPAALYCRGDTALLKRPLVAVANSNGASQAQRDRARAAVEIALDCGYRPVTGHNRPEYQDVALAACRRSFPTCYVLDRGLVTVAGARHGSGLFPSARIWQTPDAARLDLVISACAPTAPAAPGSNRRRDAIVMQLATVLLTTHLRPGGTMERLVAHALSARVPVAWIGEPLPAGALNGADTAARFEPDDKAAIAAWLMEQVADR